MREIKFRGLGFDGKWHHGNLSVVTVTHDGLKEGTYISNAAGMPFAYRVYPGTVGQFTGLSDKDGTDIYSGDVVCIKNNTKTYKDGILMKTVYY